MKTSFIILTLFLVGGLSAAYSPNVTSQGIIGNAVFLVNETATIDVSQIFSGYNLTFTTNLSHTTATVLPPVSVPAASQFELLAPNQTFVSQSYSHDKTGNIAYSGYILYVTLDNYLYWANMTNYTSVPQIVGAFQITSLTNVHCYGASQISRDLVVIDCASFNDTAGQLDWFFYISLSNKTVVSSYNNTATTNTTYNNVTGTANRGIRTADFGNRNHFIFRYVGSDAIANPIYQNKSYVEVYKAHDWTRPRPYTIISSEVLGVSTLNLATFELVNDALFILSNTGTVFYIQNYNVSFEYNIVNTFSFPPGYTVVGLTAGVEYYQTIPQLTVLAYTSNIVWEINWTIPNAPAVTQTYTFGSDITVLKADYSNNFVVVHVNSTLFSTHMVSFDRGSGFSQLRKDIPVTNLPSVIWWSLDRAFNNLYLLDVNFTEIHNFHFQKSWLLFNSTALANGSATVSATSFGSDGWNATATVTFSYSVINQSEFQVYVNSPVVNVTLQYPSSYSLKIDGLASGPGLNYAIQKPFPTTNYTFQSYSNLDITLPAAFQPTTIYYHKIAPNSSTPGTFNWLLQADNFILYNLLCTETVNSAGSPTLNCINVIGSFALPDEVTQLLISAQYITVISLDSPTSVLFFSPALQLIANVSTGNSPDYACAGLALLPSGSFIACSQTIPDQIILWNASNPQPANQIIINRTQILQNEVPIFSPQDLVVTSSYPNWLFVRNDVGVVVLALISTLGTAEVVSNIVLPAALVAPPNFDFIVNSNSILFFITVGTTSYLQEYTLGTGLATPLFTKQYSQFFNYTYQQGANAHYSSATTNKFFAVVQDAQQTPELLTFQARTSGNNNYLHGFNLSWPIGNALLSGVHSNIINAEFLLIGNSFADLSAFIVWDSTIFAFNAYLNSSSSVQENTNFSLNVSSSLSGASSVLIPFSVLTFNSDPTITPGPQANNSKALNFINFTTNQTSFIFNPSDFFSGIVTNYLLIPANSSDNGKIYLQKPVNAGSTAFNTSFNFFDLAMTSQYIYAQGNTTLAQINASNTSSPVNLVDLTVSTIIPGYQLCTRLVVDARDLYSVSFCLDTLNTIGYLVTVSFLTSSPTTLPPVNTPLTSINSITKVGNFLFLLENPNGQLMNPGAKLHVYNFTNPVNPTYGGYLSGTTFNSNSFRVGSVDYVNIAVGYSRFYLTDAQFGIRTIEWNSSNGQWNNPQSYNLLNDPAFIADNIPYNANFLGLSILQPVNANVSNSTLIALTTDIYNSYTVQLNFPASGLQAVLLAIYKKASAAVNLPKISSISNTYTYFAVSGYNFNTRTGVVTVYNATSANQTSQIITIPYSGAGEGSNAFTLLNQSTNIKFWTYSSLNRTPSALEAKLKDSNGGSIQEYLITPFFAVSVVPGSNLTSNYVNLTGSNANSSQTVSFNITYAPGPSPGPSPGPDPGPGPGPGPSPSPGPGPTDNTSKWWVWVLVAVGILAIIATIFAFIRYRNKKKEEAEVAGDAVNVPLTINYAY